MTPCALFERFGTPAASRDIDQFLVSLVLALPQSLATYLSNPRFVNVAFAAFGPHHRVF